MAINENNPSPKPAINEWPINLYQPGDVNRMHWYDRPGGGWTLPAALTRSIYELTIHWMEEHTPGGESPEYYISRLAKIAYYHAFERDWDAVAPGIQGGNGIMYHYCIDPTGGIWQTSPETLRTWNAREANAHNIAISVMAGHGDPLYPQAVASLRNLMAWFCYGRADLPLITPTPQRVMLLNPDGHTMDYATVGVLTHDESLARHGHETKGCPGPYAAVVQQWRQLQTVPPTAGG